MNIIGIEYPDGTVRGIYSDKVRENCSGEVGDILLRHYSHSEEIEQLLDLGHLNSLGTELGTNRGKEKGETGPDVWTPFQCIAFKRDFGITGTSDKAQIYKDRQHFLVLGELMYDNIFAYLYDTNGVWLMYDYKNANLPGWQML